MMKKHKYQIFPIIIAIVLLVACTKNDKLLELGDVGEFTANIYFNPLSPIADAGAEIECEIEYWTVGDEISEEHLMEEISTIETVEIDFTDVDYTFKHEIDSVTTEQQKYQSYSFDFTNWNPEKNAYLVTPEYLIDPAFKKISENQNSQTTEDFINILSPEMIDAMLAKLVDVLDEEGCRSVLVDKYQIVDENAFSGAVTIDNEFSDSEIQYCIQQMNQVDKHLLLGSKYKYSKSTGISLSYKIINGFGAEAESYRRYFTIK